MKGILALLFALSAGAGLQAQSQENQVKATIEQFARYAELRNTDGMALILNEHFRVIGNQLFGATTVSVMDKEVYISFLADGKLGGEKLKVTFHESTISGKNAMVHATLTGDKTSMNTYFLLIQTNAGSWEIVSDLPHLQ